MIILYAREINVIIGDQLSRRTILLIVEPHISAARLYVQLIYTCKWMIKCTPTAQSIIIANRLNSIESANMLNRLMIISWHGIECNS